MSVREGEATVAVEAAARKAYETNVENRRRVFPPGVKFRGWDELDPITKNGWREDVLPLIWAALEALPDRSRGLWLEGYYAHESGIHEEACPYPLV